VNDLSEERPLFLSTSRILSYINFFRGCRLICISACNLVLGLISNKVTVKHRKTRQEPLAPLVVKFDYTERAIRSEFFSNTNIPMAIASLSISLNLASKLSAKLLILLLPLAAPWNILEKTSSGPDLDPQSG
jgi:hypothetical protein